LTQYNRKVLNYQVEDQSSGRILLVFGKLEGFGVVCFQRVNRWIDAGECLFLKLMPPTRAGHTWKKTFVTSQFGMKVC
jgi:hypothetical protein